MGSLKSLITACVAVWTLTANAQSPYVPQNLDMSPKILEVLNFDWIENNGSCVVLPDSLSVKKTEWENDIKENSKIKFEGFVEIQSCLYDNFTFEQYSENPWAHFWGSVAFPISKNTNISLSESTYCILENKNPICKNNITDLVLSHSFGKISLSGWFQFSQYPNKKGSDMLSFYSMFNFSPNDKFSVCVVPYKPLLLDWKKNSDFYILSKFEYKISNDIKVFLWTMTSCTDNWKTLFWFGFSSSISDNLSAEFSTIPDEKSGIIPGWFQWIIRWTFWK